MLLGCRLADMFKLLNTAWKMMSIPYQAYCGYRVQFSAFFAAILVRIRGAQFYSPSAAFFSNAVMYSRA